MKGLRHTPETSQGFWGNSVPTPRLFNKTRAISGSWGEF